MNVLLLNSVQNTLEKAIQLIDLVDTPTYCNASIGPYYSSIGAHVRHVLDFFDCIVRGIPSGSIDFTTRKRNVQIATHPQLAKLTIAQLIPKIRIYTESDTAASWIHITDDLGEGKLCTRFTLESVLVYATSHAMHHYAIIGIILNQLNVPCTILGFGYNPTTPNQQPMKVQE